MGGLLYDSAVKLGACVDGIGLWTELSFKKNIYIYFIAYIFGTQATVEGWKEWIGKTNNWLGEKAKRKWRKFKETWKGV